MITPNHKDIFRGLKAWVLTGVIYPCPSIFKQNNMKDREQLEAEAEKITNLLELFSEGKSPKYVKERVLEILTSQQSKEETEQEVLSRFKENGFEMYKTADLKPKLDELERIKDEMQSLISNKIQPTRKDLKRILTLPKGDKDVSDENCNCKDYLAITFTKNGDFCGNCGKKII